MGKLNLVAAGFALTAVTYGLARFAYGLMLPDIRADLGIDATVAGWIGGSAFATYCLGIGVTLVAGSRVSPRLLTVLAGVFATSGLALAASAASAWAFGLAIALAGLSTGLTSPPLATAVAATLSPVARPLANGAINAGTAGGIVFSGVAVIAFQGNWRGVYVLFACLCAAVTLWLFFAMPAVSQDDDTPRAFQEPFRQRGAGTLYISAILAGAANTAIWTFGANILREELHFTDVQIAIAWVLLGLGGVAGLVSGALTARFGTAGVHRFAIGGMAMSLIGLGLAPLAPIAGFLVMALFGLAYIVSSGVFLLWGTELYSDRPAFGLGLPFLMLALGQTAGAPLFGTLWAWAGLVPAVGCFATLMCTASILAPDSRPWVSSMAPRQHKSPDWEQ